MLKTGRFRVAGIPASTVFDHVYAPATYGSRLRGLIGRPAPGARDAWWFRNCSAVHTFGMRYPIDVIHLSADGRIVRVVTGLMPNRWSWCRSARDLIETASGNAHEFGLDVNDRLEYVE